MKKYAIYYNLESDKRSLSFDEAIQSDDLNEVISRLEFVKSGEDSISVYMNDIRSRVMFFVDTNSKSYIFEIHDASKGVIFSKNIYKEELICSLRTEFNKVIADPIKFGFTSESF